MITNELYQKNELFTNAVEKKSIEKRFQYLDELEFKLKKIDSFVTFELYQNFASKRKLQRLADCGTFLGFSLYKHIEIDEYQKRLTNANFCRDRFCPLCNLRRARKYAIENINLLKAIQNAQSVRYIFATFTIKNPRVKELKYYVKLFNRAWQRMTQTKRWKNSILGYIKAIEIPFQKNDNNYINLHAHCLLIVPSVYFKGDLYIKQKEFQEMWQRALRVDYVPSVDVRIIKPNKNRNEDDEIASVVAETTKYPLKSIDLVKLNGDWKKFKILVEQSSHMRFLAFGGIARDYRKKLFGSDEFDDTDLIGDYGELDEALWQKIGKLWYSLDAGDYKLYKFEAL